MKNEQSKDIAIVGMAGRFPEANTIVEFYENLKNGKDSVKPLSEKRIKDTTLPTDLDYQIMGYLEDLDKFDHKFFNISMLEAQNMDPHQRQLLEVVYELLETSGYNVDEFNESLTSVYVSATDYQYQNFVDKFESTTFSGTTHFSSAGRIARAFNLRGPASIADTGCSSALVAVNLALNDLLLGNADYAIAAGIRLIMFPALKKLYIDVGVTSKNGKTKSFSDDSHGSGSCEAVGAILLKPLEKAIADKDMIFGVIKSAAMNQSGQHSGSLTATSATAQKEVIQTTWKKAGIDPETVSYIEAHGSGTQLGDPIEINGIDLAFRDFTDKKQFCAVSSVKTNIGHTDTAAGMAGLMKAALSLDKKELFPNLHFDKPNPFIDFENSAVFIPTKTTPWTPACGIRRAGVSSFGFAGNNTHVLMEEFIPQETANEQVLGDREYFFPITSKTTEGLRRNIEAIKNYLEKNPSIQAADVSYTLSKRRKHHEIKAGFFAKTIDQLLEQLKNYEPQGEGVDAAKHILLISDQLEIAEAELEQLRKDAAFETAYKQVDKYWKGEKNERFNELVVQLGMHGLLLSNNINQPEVLGIGRGELIADHITGDISLETLVEQFSSTELSSDEASVLAPKLERLVEQETELDKVIFFGLKNGILERIIDAFDWPDRDDFFELITVSPQEGLQHFYAGLFTLGAEVDWSTLEMPGNKTWLPPYQFEKTRCWLDIFKGQEPLAENHPKYYEALGMDEETLKAKHAALDSANLNPITYKGEPGWTEMQRGIAGIWVEVLKMDKVGLDDDFFKLGGHSLFGVKIINRIEKRFHVKLSFKDIATFSTVRKLAEGVENLMGQSGATMASSIPQADEKEFYALSASQKRLWIINELEEKANTAYNLPSVVLIDGKLDKSTLEDVFGQLIQRHENLRTSFAVQDGTPMQKVHETIDFNIDFMEGEYDELPKIMEGFIRPFDLSTGPLIRVGLVEMTEEKFALLLDMHHIISDGFSMNVMIGEFISLYKGEKLPELSVQYKDYAEWQQEFLESNDLKEQEKFWLETFQEVPEPLNLPLDFKRPPVQSFEGSDYYNGISSELTCKLRTLASEKGTTVFNLMLAAYNLLLYKLSGNSEIVVGSPVSGRVHSDLENLLGIFINTLAFKNSIVGDEDFDTYLQKVNANTLKALDHQEYPFEYLVEQLNIPRDLSRNPLFDTLFLYQHNVNEGGEILPGLKFSSYNFEKSSAQFDLTLEVREGLDEIGFRWEYCTKLFTQETIARFNDCLGMILEQIVEEQAKKIKDISILSTEERQEIISRSQSNAELIEESYIEFWEKNLSHNLDRPAVVFGGKSLSFGELNELSNQIGTLVKKQFNPKPNSVIAFLSDRNADTIPGYLGIIKSGAAILPIDPSLPKERIEFMLKDSKAIGLISNGVALDEAINIDSISLDTILKASNASEKASNTSIAPLNRPDDLLYVCYTSGSTGQPKGVKVSHLNLVNFVPNLEYRFQMKSGQKILALTSFGFDISMLEILASLCLGLQVVMADTETVAEPEKILSLVESQKIDVLQLTPSRLKMLIETGGTAILQSLQTALIGGEAMPEDLWQWLGKQKFKSFNVYGPTETCIWSTSSEVNGGKLNIGTPLLGESTFVLDQDLQWVPDGSVGELFIGGSGVAQGYIGDGVLSREKFLSNPLNSSTTIYRTGDLVKWNKAGQLEFIGRVDDQIKYRGYRIEPGEIELALKQHSAIQDGVVLIQNNEAGQRLTAFLTTKAEVSPAELRTFLQSQLPEYCIPEVFIPMEKFPLNNSGKVDKKALKTYQAPALGTAKQAVELTDTETIVLEKAIEVLGAEGLHISDNFFEVGGNSLKATALASRIKHALAIALPLRSIFKYPVLKDLANYIDYQGKQSSNARLTKAPKAEYYPLSSAQKKMFLMSQMEEAGTIYNLPAALEVTGPLDKEKVQEVFQQIVQRHESLRTSFFMHEGEPVQAIAENVSLEINFSQDSNPDLNALVKPFDLSQAPLMRVNIIETAPNKHILFYDMHHIISDGTSIAVLVNEFIHLYQGHSMEEPRFTYKDYLYSFELNTNDQQEKAAYWKKHLEGFSPLNLSTDFERTEHRGFEGQRVYFTWEPELLDSLKAVASNNQATLYSVLMTAYNVLLAKYSGDEKITVGVPVAGRPDDQLQNLIGMFVNTLPVCQTIDEKSKLDETLRKVHENLVTSFDHQDYPLEKIVSDLNLPQDRSRNPLFDTVLVLQNMEFTSQTIDDLSFKSIALETGKAKFDMTWEFTERQYGLELINEFNAGLFKIETVEEMVNDLKSILKQWIENPDLTVEQLNLAKNYQAIKQEVESFDFDFEV